MNKHFLIILLSLISVVSCKPKKVEGQRNKRLLIFKSKAVMNVDEIVAQDTTYINKIYAKEFNDKTDTIEYRGNLIYISYLSIVNGCSNYDGDLKFKSDSIILMLNNISGIECAETRCDRLIYTVQNLDKKRYKIKKH